MHVNLACMWFLSACLQSAMLPAYTATNKCRAEPVDQANALHNHMLRKKVAGMVFACLCVIVMLGQMLNRP